MVGASTNFFGVQIEELYLKLSLTKKNFLHNHPRFDQPVMESFHIGYAYIIIIGY